MVLKDEFHHESPETTTAEVVVSISQLIKAGGAMSQVRVTKIIQKHRKLVCKIDKIKAEKQKRF